MAHSGGKLVTVASHAGKYHVDAFNAENGNKAWNAAVPWPGTHHGAHMSRPAIVGNKLFVRPSMLDLQSGKVLEAKMSGGGCGTYAFTEHAAFYRSGIVTMWSMEDKKTSGWARLRPGCWLSTVPALGMVLSPEGGGGCKCEKWLETSIVFKPKKSSR
jgi:hypothetical protein